MDAADLRNPSLLFSLATKEARQGSGEGGFGWEVTELGPQRRTYLHGDAASSLRFAADWGVMPEGFMRFPTAREQVEALFGYSAAVEWTNAMFNLFGGSPYERLVAGKEGEFIAAAEQNAGILAARGSSRAQGAFDPRYGNGPRYGQQQHSQQQYVPQQQYGAPQDNQPQGGFASPNGHNHQPPAQAQPPAPPQTAPNHYTASEQVSYESPFTPPAQPGSIPLSGYGQPPAHAPQHQAAGGHAHVPPGHHAPQPPAGAVAPVAPDPFVPVAGGTEDEIPFDPSSTVLQGAGDTDAVLNQFRTAVN